jgi:16S rRNA (guanine966-N2)-methyltransferase
MRPASKAAAKRAAASSAPHEVRIIGGRWKRSKLPVADRPGLRPTPDRVRETLFNWLGQDLTGWRCLDAFAGSGALGFEAASRGAAQVLLLERDPRLLKSLAATKERLQADAVQCRGADALAFMASSAASTWELVFIDPPFDADLFVPALTAAARLLVPDGFLYLEADRGFTAADVDGLGLGLTLHRSARAGAVHFHLLQRPPTLPATTPRPEGAAP